MEDAQGRMTVLDRLSDLRRKGVAARLLSTPGQKVLAVIIVWVFGTVVLLIDVIRNSVSPSCFPVADAV